MTEKINLCINRECICRECRTCPLNYPYPTSGHVSTVHSEAGTRTQKTIVKDAETLKSRFAQSGAYLNSGGIG
jgi:hypothetical protein